MESVADTSVVCPGCGNVLMGQGAGGWQKRACEICFLTEIPLPEGFSLIQGSLRAAEGDLFLFEDEASMRFVPVEPEHVGRPAADFLALARKRVGLVVISGGQTGADLGGLVAATKAGLTTGGYAPKGFLTEKGPQPVLESYGLVEAPSAKYAERTFLNVRFSDATIIFSRNPQSPGSAQTISFAEKLGRPYLLLAPSCEQSCIDQINAFLEKTQPLVLNIAGNRESKAPGICKDVVRILAPVFQGFLESAR